MKTRKSKSRLVAVAVIAVLLLSQSWLAVFASTVAEQPNITVHPQEQNILYGNFPMLTVEAEPPGDDGTLSYQWYRNTTGSNSSGTSVGSGSSYTIPANLGAGTYYFYAVVTNSRSGATSSSVNSNAAKVVINSHGSYQLSVNVRTGGRVKVGSNSWTTSSRTYSYAAGEAIRIEADSNYNYDFDMWSVSPSVYSSNFSNIYSAYPTFVMPDQSVTLTANFERYYSGNNRRSSYYDYYGTWTITYRANGGGGSSYTTYTDDERYDAPENRFTAPTGKVFKEWNTQSDGSGRGYQPGDKVMLFVYEFDLYAIWEDIEPETPAEPEPEPEPEPTYTPPPPTTTYTPPATTWTGGGSSSQAVTPEPDPEPEEKEFPLELYGVPDVVRVGDSFTVRADNDDNYDPDGWEWDERYLDCEPGTYRAYFTALEPGTTAIAYTNGDGESDSATILIEPEEEPEAEPAAATGGIYLSNGAVALLVGGIVLLIVAVGVLLYLLRKNSMQP